MITSNYEIYCTNDQNALMLFSLILNDVIEMDYNALGRFG